MEQYSIHDLDKLSGIKAHTIRVWERRFKIVTPHRTGPTEGDMVMMNSEG